MPTAPVKMVEVENGQIGLQLWCEPSKPPVWTMCLNTGCAYLMFTLVSGALTVAQILYFVQSSRGDQRLSSLLIGSFAESRVWFNLGRQQHQILVDGTRSGCFPKSFGIWFTPEAFNDFLACLRQAHDHLNATLRPSVAVDKRSIKQ